MRTPGVKLHKLTLFGWAVVITAILLLLSLPVLAGIILPALNLAKCWKEIYICFIFWSAGNLVSLNLLRIFRDYTPKFICYKYLNKKFFSNSLNTNSDFASYLAGLIEGDGSIIVPKTERSAKGKLNYPSLQIAFDLRDLPLALILQSKLKHGSVNRKKGVNAYILTINNYEGIVMVAQIINGFMRTPKISSLHRLIDWLNYKHGLNIEKKTKDLTDLYSNRWLAGFIDADGHFSVRVSLDKDDNLKRIACSFELTQRQNDHNSQNNYVFLSLISNLLFTTVKEVRKSSISPEYRVRTTSLKGNLILVKYLDKYSLFSSKYLNYKDWRKVLTYFENKTHTKEESIKCIIGIKSNMNNQRKDFNWNHLSEIYNLYI